MSNLITHLLSLCRSRPVIKRIAAARLAVLVLTRIRALRTDAGMTTAEYAVGTVAACAFAAVLYRVVTGDSVVSALGNLVESALATLS